MSRASDDREQTRIQQAMEGKAQMRGLPIIRRRHGEKIPAGLMSRTQARDLGVDLESEPAALVIADDPYFSYKRIVWWVYARRAQP